MTKARKDTNLGSTPIFDTLSMKHQEAIVMRFYGARENQIAKELGEKYYTVRKWFENGGPCYDAYEEMKRAQAKLNKKRLKKLDDQIQNALPEMFDVLYESAKRGNWMAAQSYLDRGGHAPVTKFEGKIDNTDKEHVMAILKELRNDGNSTTIPDDQKTT